MESYMKGVKDKGAMRLLNTVSHLCNVLGYAPTIDEIRGYYAVKYNLTSYMTELVQNLLLNDWLRKDEEKRFTVTDVGKGMLKHSGVSEKVLMEN